MRIQKELLEPGIWLDPHDTDWDTDNDKCPIPEGETDTSDEVRDLEL